MTIKFYIVPDRGLVVVRGIGHVTVDDLVQATKEYLTDPDYEAGQKQIVDFSHMTSFEHDYTRFMEVQASKIERLADTRKQSIVVYFAPTPISQDISAVFVRSWNDVGGVVPLVQHSEAEALALLGQPETTIDSLLETFVK